MNPEAGATARDEALRAVGRTVVNFQRLEQLLKQAALLAPFQGTVQKIGHDLGRRQERAATFTLGQAIQRWVDALQGAPAQPPHVGDLFDATVQFTFSVEGWEDHAAALAKLLETRNRLVHGGLLAVDWASPEACRRLATELGPVNAAIGAETAFIKSVLDAFRSGVDDIVREHAHD